MGPIVALSCSVLLWHKNLCLRATLANPCVLAHPLTNLARELYVLGAVSWVQLLSGGRQTTEGRFSHSGLCCLSICFTDLPSLPCPALAASGVCNNCYLLCPGSVKEIQCILRAPYHSQKQCWPGGSQHPGERGYFPTMEITNDPPCFSSFISYYPQTCTSNARAENSRHSGDSGIFRGVCFP